MHFNVCNQNFPGRPNTQVITVPVRIFLNSPAGLFWFLFIPILQFIELWISNLLVIFQIFEPIYQGKYRDWADSAEALLKQVDSRKDSFLVNYGIYVLWGGGRGHLLSPSQNTRPGDWFLPFIYKSQLAVPAWPGPSATLSLILKIPRQLRETVKIKSRFWSFHISD